MREQRIVIFHSDEVYANRFASYVNRQKKGMCAVAFTERELLIKYLTDYADSTLLCEESISDRTTIQKICSRIIWLSEERTADTAKNTCYSYSSVDEILRKAAEESSVANYEIRERIVGFFSLSDDGRSTTEALELAEREAYRKKLLFVGMSPLYRPGPDLTRNAVFEEIKRHEYKLYFEEYPDKNKLKEIFLNNKDVADKDIKAIDSTKALIDKLTEDGNVTKLQLMQELFGMSKDELAKILEGGE